MNKRLFLNNLLLISLVTPSVYTQGQPQPRPKIKKPKPVKVQHKNDEVGLLDLAFFATLGGVAGVILTSAVIHILDRKKSTRLEDLLNGSRDRSEPLPPLNDPIPATKQNDLTCGYHAIKNVIALGNQEHRGLLTNKNFTKTHIDQGGWRSIIRGFAQRTNKDLPPDITYDERGLNLDEVGIQEIVNYCKAPHRELLGQNDSVTVISDINQLSANTLQSLQQPGMHRVILRTHSGNGHWIAAVINQAGTMTYEWADSAGSNYYPELVQLIQRVEPEQPSQAQNA